LELHGTARRIECQDCGQHYEVEPLLDEFRRLRAVPPCAACGGRLKTATISFGQMLPPEILHESFSLAKRADLFLAIGSSLVVEPAASLPRVAKEYGARLVIINRDPTPLDTAADVVIRETIGATLAGIDMAVGNRADK
jgi:NAD-dependent deacetylase